MPVKRTLDMMNQRYNDNKYVTLAISLFTLPYLSDSSAYPYAYGNSHNRYIHSIDGTRTSVGVVHLPRVVDKYGYSFVFDCDGEDATNIDTLVEISKLPFIQNTLKDTRLWLTSFENEIVVATNPVGEPVVKDRNVGICYTFIGKGIGPFQWTPKEVYHNCSFLGKFSNCGMCKRYHPHYPCTATTMLKKKLGKSGWDRLYPESMRNNYNFLFYQYTECLDREERSDLHRKLSKDCRTCGYTFLPPSTMIREFQESFIFLDDVDFNEGIENLSKRSQRSKDAAVTRKHLKICENECMHFLDCTQLTKPLYGAPTKCQQKGVWGYGVKGPFKKEHVHAMLDKFMSEPGRRSWEEVSFIAQNGGVSTHIFGYEIELRGMTQDMKNVEFSRVGTQTWKTYSFDDAMTLLTTPWRDGKSYVYPEIRHNCENLGKEQMLLYVEACHHDESPSRYPIEYVEVSNVSARLGHFRYGYYTLKSGYSQSACGMGSWWPIPQFLMQNGDLLAMVREQSAEWEAVRV